MFNICALLQQWDRFVMYSFISLMRIHNPQNFAWWAAANAGAMYGAIGSGILNVAVFFGQALTKNSLLRKIDEDGYGLPERVLERTRDALCCQPYVFAVFDNSQIGQLLKYQRGAQSSTFSKVTSRMFLQPNIPEHLDQLPD